MALTRVTDGTESLTVSYNLTRQEELKIIKTSLLELLGYDLSISIMGT